MNLAQRLMTCVSPPPPAGVQRITNEFGSFTVPAGVTSVAAAISGEGGRGMSTSFPMAHRPGGGSQVSFNDSIAVEPGQSIRFRSVNVSVGGVVVKRYEMYIFGVNGNATVLSALSGLPGNPPNFNGAGSGGAQHGTDTNRGGSAGGAPNNTTNSTDGFGVVAGETSWTYTHASGWGRGAASKNTGGSTFGGSWGCILVWGPGKGFSAGPGSYWPFA